MRIYDSLVWGAERGVGYGFYRDVDYELNMSKVEYKWIFTEV